MLETGRCVSCTITRAAYAIIVICIAVAGCTHNPLRYIMEQGNKPINVLILSGPPCKTPRNHHSFQNNTQKGTIRVYLLCETDNIANKEGQSWQY